MSSHFVAYAWMHCRYQEAKIHVVVTLEVGMKPRNIPKKTYDDWSENTSRNPWSYLKNIINTLSGCSFVCLHLVFLYVFWCVPGFLSSFLSLCVKEMCRNAVFAHLTLYPKIFCHFHHQAYYELTMACSPVGLWNSMDRALHLVITICQSWIFSSSFSST